MIYVRVYFIWPMMCWVISGSKNLMGICVSLSIGPTCDKVYVPACADCQRNKPTTKWPLGPLHPLPIPDQLCCYGFYRPTTWGQWLWLHCYIHRLSQQWHSDHGDLNGYLCRRFSNYLFWWMVLWKQNTPGSHVGSRQIVHVKVLGRFTQVDWSEAEDVDCIPPSIQWGKQMFKQDN